MGKNNWPKKRWTKKDTLQKSVRGIKLSLRIISCYVYLCGEFERKQPVYWYKYEKQDKKISKNRFLKVLLPKKLVASGERLWCLAWFVSVAGKTIE